MRFNYESTIQVAKQLLDEFGSQVTLESPEGTITTETGVMLAVSKQDRVDTLTVSVTHKVIMTADNGTPQVGDYLQIGAQKCAILMVSPLHPDGSTTIINTCYVRL